MSRKVINILFVIGSCLYIPGIALIIWGYVTLFHNLMQSSYSGAYGADPLNGLSAFIGFFWVGAIMISIGSITLLVARIGALIEIGKAQEWVWFTLMIIFGWIVLLVYLIAGPKAEPVPVAAAGYAGYPYPYPPGGQPWAGYYPPQAPGMMPPGQPWPGYYPPQAPGMVPPAPSSQEPVERQDIPDKPQAE
jgi:hypothetical protein